MCRRSARSSGQWVGQRRLCEEYMAGIETKPKHQTIGATSTVETPVELYPISVKGLSGRLPILTMIFHPVRARDGRKNTNWAADICEKYHTCVLLPAFKLNLGFFVWVLQRVYTWRLEPTDMGVPEFPITKFQEKLEVHFREMSNLISNTLLKK